MNKKEIFNAFDQKISKKCIVYRDTEYVIQGKYCVIAPIGNNNFDVWLCDPDPSQMLDQRKVRNIAANLFKSPRSEAFTELTGEGYGVVAGTELILQNLKILGLKKKRVDSPETVEKMIKRLKVTKDVRPRPIATLRRVQSRPAVLAPKLGLKAPIIEQNKGGNL